MKIFNKKGKLIRTEALKQCKTKAKYLTVKQLTSFGYKRKDIKSLGKLIIEGVE
jgi:hypothetical protein